MTVKILAVICFILSTVQVFAFEFRRNESKMKRNEKAIIYNLNFDDSLSHIQSDLRQLFNCKPGEMNYGMQFTLPINAGKIKELIPNIVVPTDKESNDIEPFCGLRHQFSIMINSNGKILANNELIISLDSLVKPLKTYFGQINSAEWNLHAANINNAILFKWQSGAPHLILYLVLAAINRIHIKVAKTIAENEFPNNRWKSRYLYERYPITIQLIRLDWLKTIDEIIIFDQENVPKK